MTKTFTSLLIAAMLAGGAAAPALAAPRHADHGQTFDSHGPQRAPARHRWHNGQRMPSAERSRYVVNDWHGHGLRQPPRGYHWVRENRNAGDYILVGIASGVIASVIAH